MGSFDSWSNGIVLSPEEINDQVFTRFEAGLPLTKVTAAHALYRSRTSDPASQKAWKLRTARYTCAGILLNPSTGQTLP